MVHVGKFCFQFAANLLQLLSRLQNEKNILRGLEDFSNGWNCMRAQEEMSNSERWEGQDECVIGNWYSQTALCLNLLTNHSGDPTNRVN